MGKQPDIYLAVSISHFQVRSRNLGFGVLAGTWEKKTHPGQEITFIPSKGEIFISLTL